MKPMSEESTKVVTIGGEEKRVTPIITALALQQHKKPEKFFVDMTPEGERNTVSFSYLCVDTQTIKSF